jgi:phosphoglycolate phosphatase
MEGKNMGRRFDLLVFDWDGTLMDSADAIVESLQAACRDLGLPVPSDERAQHIIGLGLHDAMAHVLPGVDPAEYPRVVERYGHHFRLRDAAMPLFPGAEEALRTLNDAGYLLAVATGKSRRGLERALDQTGLKTVFHATRCGEESASKPHPGMLTYLIDMLGTAAGKTLMIGDTTHDLQMAINAGVASVAAAYGAHPREQLAALQPLACMDQPQQLWHWLKRNA